MYIKEIDFRRGNPLWLPKKRPRINFLIAYMKPKNVDEYIAQAPKEYRKKLEELRAAIKEAAPGTEEKISYGMPYYGYKGRLAYFRIAKNHIGFYIMPPVVQEFEEELKGYETGKAAIQFPLDQELPVGLIKKLVRARVKISDDLQKKK